MKYILLAAMFVTISAVSFGQTNLLTEKYLPGKPIFTIDTGIHFCLSIGYQQKVVLTRDQEGRMIITDSLAAIKGLIMSLERASQTIRGLRNNGDPGFIQGKLAINGVEFVDIANNIIVNIGWPENKRPIPKSFNIWQTKNR